MHVPLAALAPGMQAVAAGPVASMMRPVGGAESLARDNRARIIALAQPNRIDRTPPAIIARLKEALRIGMRHGTTQAVCRQQAGVAEPSTRDELATFARAQWKRDGNRGGCCRPGSVLQASILSAAMKALCGISTLPNWRMRFLPSFCLSRSLRLRLMSPP